MTPVRASLAAALGATVLVGAGAAVAAPADDATPPLRKGSGRVVAALSGVDPVTGRRVSIARWRGKPVVLTVWGSWCYPCNREARELARFARRHPTSLLGLDVEDSKAGARRFYAKYGLDYPSIFDVRSVRFKRLGGFGVPTTLFLDRRHRVVAQLLGPGTLQRFEQGLALASK